METRSARVRAYAKVNLSLRVLGRRPDGYHELRTVFQTIGLADTIDIACTPGRGLSITLDDPMALADNLVTRAARLFAEHYKVRGALTMKLIKRIPAGAGLGGGSSDAAAVLLALPALTGKRASLADLMDLGARLGSDVAFFLAGGAALGIGRGEELYPLPEPKPLPVLVVAPHVHVSTPEAYRLLQRPALTSLAEPPKLNVFQSFVWSEDFASGSGNDFEAAVFSLHPELERWLRKLERSGAHVARLSGSGAALFGVFPNQARLQGALPRFRSESLTVFSTRMLTRRLYRARWSASLREHAIEGTWPPLSRYL
ncbi:MAG: 4-(cytidine 5'-diphospho)-2-C-methyl-D-erythritol kinase [Candidatus Solibacter sp.]|nr:4-(cytidine 5'-diphospho)-2-C-methyl-D-erythritol kinase [Candidatus Solibacter sp.]